MQSRGVLPVATLVSVLLGCSLRPIPVRSSAPAIPVELVQPAPVPPAAAAPISRIVAGTEPTLGTAHPTVIPMADPQGRWAVLCQARADTDGDGRIHVDRGYHGGLRADQMRPYLVVGGGPGVEIDQPVAHSANGRWLAYLRDGRLFLWDATEGTNTDLSALGADTSDDRYPHAPHRAAHFSPDNAHVLYIRRSGEQSRIVVRSLPEGVERELDPGAGTVVRAVFLSGWIRVDLLTGDTNGDGRIEVPHPLTSVPQRYRCSGQSMIGSTYDQDGDVVTVRLFPVSGGAGITAAEVVATSPTAAIIREGGALVQVRLDGVSTRLVPPTCAAHLVGWYHARDRFFVACSRIGSRMGHWFTLHFGGSGRRYTSTISRAMYSAPLWTASRRGPRFAGLRVVGFDRYSILGGRFVSLSMPVSADQSEVRIFDMDTLRVRDLNGEFQLLHGHHALVRRGARLVVVELETGTETPVSQRARPNAGPRQFGALVLYGDEVVDLRNARRLGHFVHPPVFITDDGRGLISSVPHDRGILQGPLRWQRPEP